MSVFMFCGGSLALFLTAALFSKRERHAGERLLALLLFLVAADLFLRGYIEGGYYRRFPALLGVDRSIPLLYAPLFYLLASAAAGHLRRLRPHHLLHLIPFLAHTLLLLPFYFKNDATKIFLQESFIPGVAAIEPAPTLLFTLKMLVFLGYLIAAFSAVGRHERVIREFFSTIDRYELSWFRLLLLVPVAQFIMLLATLLSHLLYRPGFVRIELPEGYYAAQILLALIAGIQLIRTPDRWRSAIDVEQLLEPETPADAEEDPGEKYRKTRLDDAVAGEYRIRLLSHMEGERPYRDPLLTLPQLAKQLGMPPHHLSQVINGLMGMNFYAFVNGLRIEHARKLLAEKGGDSNILAVAYESGFNSKSAFNTYFRKQTGMTPSEFRRRAVSRTEGGR